jgi:HK97 gp10 family phage protein
MAETVKVEGLRELRQALLRTVPAHMQGQVLQKALSAGSAPVLRAARANAPKKTGTLKRAIYATRDKRRSTGIREERIVTVRSGKRFQKSGRDAYYWRWVEFGRAQVDAGRGTRSLGTPSKGFFGKTVRAVPARPFLRPAFESQKGAALSAITKRLAREIEVAGRKASWRGSARAGRSTFT